MALGGKVNIEKPDGKKIEFKYTPDYLRLFGVFILFFGIAYCIINFKDYSIQCSGGMKGFCQYNKFSLLGASNVKVPANDIADVATQKVSSLFGESFVVEIKRKTNNETTILPYKSDYMTTNSAAIKIKHFIDSSGQNNFIEKNHAYGQGCFLLVLALIASTVLILYFAELIIEIDILKSRVLFTKKNFLSAKTRTYNLDEIVKFDKHWRFSDSMIGGRIASITIELASSKTIYTTLYEPFRALEADDYINLLNKYLREAKRYKKEKSNK